MVDFLEFSDKIQKFSIPPMDAVKIILYRIPSMTEIFLQFIILLSVTFTLTKLSIKNELTVLYSNGYSAWKILKIYGILVFMIGLIVMSFLNFIFSNSSKHSLMIENKYTKHEDKYFIKSSNGLWFRQIDPKNYEIIIRAEKVYLEELIFENVIVIFNRNDRFEKRYDAKNMALLDGFWVLSSINVLKPGEKTEFIEKILLPTQISRKFLEQQIQNRYENVDLIPLFSINKLIRESKKSGLDNHKFIVKKHTLLLTPFLYVLMVSIGILFLNNNQRNSKHLSSVLKTVVCGICIFVVQNILLELASANRINLMFSTWGSFLIAYFMVYLLLVKKIEL
jgi:lipopolysaccharide export system permease protein